ncbi:MAG: PAS domain-containing sensor histidine kinase [bacterium]
MDLVFVSKLIENDCSLSNSFLSTNIFPFLQSSSYHILSFDKYYLAAPEFWFTLGFSLIVIFNLIIYFLKKRKTYKTELAQSKLILEDSQKRYKHIVENANDGIVINVNGKITFWNEKILEMTGYNSEEVDGMMVAKVIYPEDLPKFKKIQQKVKENKDAPIRFEIRILRKDKSAIWVDIRITRFEENDGYGTLAIITDINERKMYEEKLRQALNKEKELVALKTGIISKISHEYRTPLTVIQTSTDLLKIFYKIRDDEKFEKSVLKISNSIDNMVKFLEDIVLLGKIESKMIDLNFEKVDVHSYIESIIQHHRTSKPDLQEIIFESEGKDRYFTIDLNLVNIIVNRLLSNAINYSSKDSTIKVSLNTFSDYFKICIQDNGDGIEPEKLEEIFNPYSQFIKNEFASGTGFGLAIVKESVVFLKGDIDIKSERGFGTTITVKIPDKH